MASPSSVGAFWAAFGGFALGSMQSLLVDWIRGRSQHRRQLRFWRSELRRLSGHRQKFSWTMTQGPSSDTIPNPPRITASYQRLLQETDFWLTDEHQDDNTQQALIDIADGAAMLERYASDVLRLVEQMNAASPDDKRKYGGRAIETAQIYDKTLDRWHVMVDSALTDMERRLRIAKLGRQIVRAARPMPSGVNPAPLPPITYP
jgi:hypothetical protein